MCLEFGLLHRDPINLVRHKLYYDIVISGQYDIGLSFRGSSPLGEGTPVTDLCQKLLRTCHIFDVVRITVVLMMDNSCDARLEG